MGVVGIVIYMYLEVVSPGASVVDVRRAFARSPSVAMWAIAKAGEAFYALRSHQASPPST